MIPPRILIGLLDGLDPSYLAAGGLPVLRQAAARGLATEVDAVFPTVTNVNNVSVVCGAWPEAHGISANSYFDEAAGEPRYMNDGALITAPTIFARARRHGVRSALLSAKRKSLELFAGDVDLALAAEAPEAWAVERHGRPGDIYSAGINHWLWQVAADLLATRPEIGLLYVHTTDYPMHAWAPGDLRSDAHLAGLDAGIAAARAAAPGCTGLFVADHGMNGKTRVHDLARVLAAAGRPARFVLSPERDYYIVHHRNFTGCAFVWLRAPADREPARRILAALPGVEAVWDGAAAAARFHLPPGRVGDLVVAGDRDTMFGELESGLGEDLPPTYRAHGSLHEGRVPLFITDPPPGCPSADAFAANKDLAAWLFA